MSKLTQTFFGRKEYKVDPKGRISLSSEYFPQLDISEKNNEIVIARNFDNAPEDPKFLEVFSAEQWNEKLAVIDLMDDDDDKEYLLSSYVGTAVAIELDNQNRIRLPKSLMDYAGIDKDVVFAGAIRTLRIWAKSSLDAYESVAKGSKESLRDKMNKARKLYDERESK